MQKHTAVAVLGIILFSSPVFALTADETQALIASSLQQLVALQQQLAQLQGQAGAQCVNLTYSMGHDDEDANTSGEVSKLQQFLVAQTLLRSSLPHGFFGPLTVQAVQQWQSQKGIVSSGNPDTTGYGFVGRRTRAAMACSATTPPPSQSCTFNGNTIPSGSTVTAYLASSVASGSRCISEVRTCTNGSVSGSYQYASCTAGSAASCTFNGQSVANGASVTAYQASSVPNGQTCASQTRMCMNGTLLGSFQNASCKVLAPSSVNLSASADAISTGGTVTLNSSGNLVGNCTFSGGQWGSGVSFYGANQTFTTNPLSQNTTYTMSCHEIDVSAGSYTGPVISNSVTIAINIVPNPDFSVWTNEPASRMVQTAGGGAGFAANSIADGWYAGPGPGGVYAFTRGGFGDAQTDVPDFPKYYGIFIYMVAPTTGSVDEYSSVPRDPIFELSNSGSIPFSMMAGHTWRYTFYGRVNAGTLDVAPTLWISAGRGWLPGQMQNVGDYVVVWPYAYRATSQGVTGSTPLINAATSQFDGGVNWAFAGHLKGRGYDIFESGPNAASGTAYSTGYTGVVHPGSTCTLTTSWTRCSVPISVPPSGYTNSIDYVGSGDTPRTLIPAINDAPGGAGGSFAYGGISLDRLRLPVAGEMVELAHFSVTQEDPK